MQTNSSPGATRRVFLQTAAAAGTFAILSRSGAAQGANDAPLKVGVIGCGGRGTGAAADALAASPRVRIHALGDLFGDRLHTCRKSLAGHGARVDVPDERAFSGFDSYQKVIDSGVDIVILATAPFFRHIHLAAAVAAKKHVFMEKPVATDPAGVRSVIASSELAEKNGTSIVAGTQRRHEACYLEAMKRVQDGAIGEVVSARCYWNQGGLWVKQREAGMSDMEWQVRNWLYFTWLSGDHIVEQHVHNIDVVNWAMGGPPVRATGMGGREVRRGPEYGHIYDHFAIEYEYKNGASAQSFCRQIDGCHSRVEEVVVGTKGTLVTSAGSAPIVGRDGKVWVHDGPNPNPYVDEHKDLIEAIETGKPINEGRRIAESTLTAVMGRMSAYTGQQVSWQQAMESKLDLAPAKYEFGALPPVEVAVPGKTPLV